MHAHWVMKNRRPVAVAYREFVSAQSRRLRIEAPPPRSDSGCTWYGIIADTNPPDHDSWWYRLAEEENPQGYAFFRQPPGDDSAAENLHNLPDGYYDRIRAGKDDDWLKVYVRGEYGFVRSGRPVYPEYVDRLHCRPVEPIPEQEILRCWDFGLTPACVFLQQAPNGQIRVIDELCAERSGVMQFTSYVIQYSGSHYRRQHEFDDVGDPSGAYAGQVDERSCFDVMNALGVWPREGIQDPVIRIESVKNGLTTLVDGEPLLVVDPKCKMLRAGFMGKYRHRKVAAGEERYVERPEKNAWSHPP